MITRILAVSLALLLGALHPGPSTAQQPKPAAQGAPPDWDSEEEQIRAREDVVNLEAWVKAKRAQLREADLRVAVIKERQSNLDRQKSKGYISGVVHNTGEVSVVEAEADRETRAAELKEVETRRDRARRRLALIDRGLSPAPARRGFEPVEQPRDRPDAIRNRRPEAPGPRTLAGTLNPVIPRFIAT